MARVKRQTRSATYNLESNHLVYDEDNALISTSEDDEEESSLYISYSSDSHEFGDFCKSRGIHKEFTVPYTPIQNDVVERINRTI